MLLRIIKCVHRFSRILSRQLSESSPKCIAYQKDRDERRSPPKSFLREKVLKLLERSIVESKVRGSDVPYITAGKSNFPADFTSNFRPTVDLFPATVFFFFSVQYSLKRHFGLLRNWIRRGTPFPRIYLARLYFSSRSQVPPSLPVRKTRRFADDVHHPRGLIRNSLRVADFGPSILPQSIFFISSDQFCHTNL